MAEDQKPMLLSKGMSLDGYVASYGSPRLVRIKRKQALLVAITEGQAELLFRKRRNPVIAHITLRDYVINSTIVVGPEESNIYKPGSDFDEMLRKYRL
jgi:hypothetical protein